MNKQPLTIHLVFNVKLLLKVVVLVGLLFCQHIGFSQKSGTIQNEDGVLIAYEYTHCDMARGYDQEHVIFEIENPKSIAVHIEWNYNLWYNEVCKTCETRSEEYVVSIDLQPNESIKGNCSLPNNQLAVFSKFDDANYTSNQRLTKFEIRDLRVEAQSAD